MALFIHHTDVDPSGNKVFVSGAVQLCEIMAGCSAREVLKCIKRHS